MNIKNYSKTYLTSKIQIIEVDFNGKIITFENTTINIKKGNNIKEIHPFFESIFLILEEIKSNTLFSCVEIIQNSKKILVDVTLVKKKNQLYFIITDFTNHYNESNTLIQEKNETTITKNKLLFEKELLLEKEKLKNTFLAKLSNELRNPLGTIMSLVSLFQESKLDYNQTQILQLIKNTGGYFENLLNDLLDISKISKGELELKNIPFKITDITKYLENIYQYKASNQQIKLSFIIDKNTPKTLIGDSTRLKQILINLLESAFKYTQKGTIKVSIKQVYERAKKATILFIVEDSSSGLANSELASVFKEYKQINSLLNPITSQSLGLKIVEDLVSLQQGSILAKSTVDEGTSFHITIPYQIPLVSNTKKNKTYTKIKIELCKTIKLILVDDSEINQLILTKYCITEGNYKIDLANSQKTAIDLLEKKDYDVFLINLDMPFLNSSKLIKIIKNNFKNLPIISISGKAIKTEKEKFLKLGLDSYLTNPYTKDEFFNEINKLLNSTNKYNSN